MNKIIFPFMQSRDSELAKTANRILSGSKSNTKFTDTTLVTTLENRLTEFQVAMNNAGDGSKTMIAVRKEKRRALIEVMIQLAHHVSQVSNGDRAMLLSSGFDVAKESFESRSLANIQSLKVTTGKHGDGEANIMVKPVKGARAFIHQYSADPPSETTAWVSETTAHRKHTFRGLKPLATHWFRVIAIGLNGQSVISDPISKLIL